MQRIIVSLLFITGSLAAITAGATGAFFSDTETSAGNIFTAGAIDLKVDNESYYNGVLNQGTSWVATDLTVEKFFNFLDLKPDDYGEDTISIHVDTNDSYLCANVTLTSHLDNTQNEPEALVDANGLADAELAPLVNFIWWADDGDNVLETGENVINQGPIGALSLNTPYPLTLADSDENIWGPAGPIAGEQTYYIGKAWCFGDIGAAPDDQDGVGNVKSPAGNNNGNGISGEPEDGGFTCDGTGLGNESQTDSLTADVSFSAVQSRNNPSFQCEEPQGTTLTLQKIVVNDDLGTAVDTNFTLIADGPTDISGVEGNAAVTAASVTPGVYDLSESGGPGGYAASAWACVGGTQNDNNTVTIAQGQNVTCTITNDDNEPLACEVPSVAFADNVVTSSQGVRKNGTPVLANRSNTASVLGVNQSSGLASDPAVPAGSFFSLGFKNNGATDGGSIVVEFTNNVIVNGPGNDLQVWEVTGGTYPDEHVRVEVSQDGVTWFTAAANLTRDAQADLAASGLAWAKFIRLTDVTPIGAFEPEADAYDLDAFSALNCAVPPGQLNVIDGPQGQ